MLLSEVQLPRGPRLRACVVPAIGDAAETLACVLAAAVAAATARATLPAAARAAAAAACALSAVSDERGGAAARTAAAVAAELALAPPSDALLFGDGAQLAPRLATAALAAWLWALARRVALSIAGERLELAPALPPGAGAAEAAAALAAPVALLGAPQLIGPGAGARALARAHAARALCALCESARSERDPAGARRAALFEPSGAAWDAMCRALAGPLDEYARRAQGASPQLAAWCGRALCAALVASRAEDRCGVVHLSGGAAPALAPVARATIAAEALALARGGGGPEHTAAADALAGALRRAAAALGADELEPLVRGGGAWEGSGGRGEGLPSADACAARLAAAMPALAYA